MSYKTSIIVIVIFLMAFTETENFFSAFQRCQRNAGSYKFISAFMLKPYPLFQLMHLKLEIVVPRSLHSHQKDKKSQAYHP